MKTISFSAAILAFVLVSCGKKNVPATSGNTKMEVTADETVYTFVEEMPQFPGGDAALIDFLNRNILYPQEARDNEEQGRVMVEFVVTKEGQIINPKVTRGVSESLDKEALRVINLMPPWKPGKQNGKPVNVRYMLPITFKLV